MMLSELQARGVGELFGADATFTNITTDSRKVSPGDVFVALRGENFDGHEFVQSAYTDGAVAVVVESKVESDKPQLVVKDTMLALGDIAKIYREQFKGKVIALTGSCGKTSVKGMLHNILLEAGNCISTQGNFNNHIGVPLTLFRLSNAANYAVVEAGTSGPGEIKYLTSLIHPHVSLVNNVMPAHLEGLGSVEGVAKEKSDIHSDDETETCVINLDDASAATMFEKVGLRNTIGFTQDPLEVSPELLEKLDVFVAASHVVETGISETEFTLETPDQSETVRLNVPGKHNVSNALAAASCAIAVGIPLEVITLGLGHYGGDKGRMQFYSGVNNSVIIDDTYNANPGSMRAAIDFLSKKENPILISGDMGELGDNAEAFHQELGEYAKVNGVRCLFTVGGRAAHMSQAFGEGASHYEEKDELVNAVKAQLQEGAVVLVKGSRSAQMETVVQKLRLEEGA